jgi:hypothetical protein
MKESVRDCGFHPFHGTTKFVRLYRQLTQMFPFLFLRALLQRYWFFESRNQPDTDPLILWMTYVDFGSQQSHWSLASTPRLGLRWLTHFLLG